MVSRATECGASALFVRAELSRTEDAAPQHLVPAVQWTSLPAEPLERGVARLATWAPGSADESGVIDLGPWPGGLAANGPCTFLCEAIAASRAASSSGSMAGRSAALGMDPVGLSLLVISCVVLTVVAALLTHAALG